VLELFYLPRFFYGGKMLFLNAAEIEMALPMSEAIAAMKTAYIALSTGNVDVPLRTRITCQDNDGMALFMPVYLNHDNNKVLGIKTVSVFPKNSEKSIPIIHAVVIVLDAITGEINAVLEGSTLTAIRTGAASGAAADILSRENSQVGAIIGAGVQGRTQLQAICSVRNLEQVWIYDLNTNNAKSLMEDLAGQDPIPDDIRIADSPRQAVENADIICTATTSRKPVFDDEDIKPGVHICGVGSYTPEMIEIPPEVIQRAAVFVGSREGVLAEAGEIIESITQGFLENNDLVELGEVLDGSKPGRTNADQITIFKSVGTAVQDAAAASLAINNAKNRSIGTELNW
jgi:ornithine cyclodeaminase